VIATTSQIQNYSIYNSLCYSPTPY
jgi:hypothetical protein